MSSPDQVDAKRLVELRKKFFDANDRWPSLCHAAVNADWIEAKFRCVGRNSDGSYADSLNDANIHDRILVYPLHSMHKDVSEFCNVSVKKREHGAYKTRDEWSLLEFDDTKWYGRYYSLESNKTDYKEAVRLFIIWGEEALQRIDTHYSYEPPRRLFELLYKVYEKNRFSAHIHPPNVKLPPEKSSCIPIRKAKRSINLSRWRDEKSTDITLPDINSTITNSTPETPPRQASLPTLGITSCGINSTDNDTTGNDTTGNDIEMRFAWLEPNIFLAAAKALENLEAYGWSIDAYMARTDNKRPLAIDESNGPADSNELQKLTPAVQQAYIHYQHAEGCLGRILQDREAYAWLKEKQDADLEHGGYKLPTYLTWARYLRKARRALGEQKHTPRHGRPKGSSIVKADQLDSRRGDNE